MVHHCINTNPIGPLPSPIPSSGPTRHIHQLYWCLPRPWWVVGWVRLWWPTTSPSRPCSHRLSSASLNQNFRPLLHQYFTVSDWKLRINSTPSHQFVLGMMVMAAADQRVARFMPIHSHYYHKSSFLDIGTSVVPKFMVLLTLPRPMAASVNHKRLHNNQMGGGSDICPGYCGWGCVRQPQPQFYTRAVRSKEGE